MSVEFKKYCKKDHLLVFRDAVPSFGGDFLAGEPAAVQFFDAEISFFGFSEKHLGDSFLVSLSLEIGHISQRTEISTKMINQLTSKMMTLLT